MHDLWFLHLDIIAPVLQDWNLFNYLDGKNWQLVKPHASNIASNSCLNFTALVLRKISFILWVPGSHANSASGLINLATHKIPDFVTSVVSLLTTLYMMLLMNVPLTLVSLAILLLSNFVFLRPIQKFLEKLRKKKFKVTLLLAFSFNNLRLGYNTFATFN